MKKQAGGTFAPASDLELEKTTKFKTGEMYTVEIKRTRNPAFHRKMFAFLNFCYSHWSGDHTFLEPTAQFDEFRRQLTILAGYYDAVFDLKGNPMPKAKSLSYAQMSPETFEQCYNAMINAAMQNIFNPNDTKYYNQLMAFFS